MISIHASRGGSDNSLEYPPAKYFDFNPRFPWGKRPSTFCPSGAVSAFQSTLPVGEATKRREKSMENEKISIHASRGGSDKPVPMRAFILVHFNPRFPWGKRLAKFLIKHNHVNISIHASRGGSDAERPLRQIDHRHFNPRFPWGKRLICFSLAVLISSFQSTLPVGEATRFLPKQQKRILISIHASRGGSD